MKSELVMMGRFLKSEEAEIGQGLLESEGIESFVADELLSHVHPGITGASGGVRLMVHAKDMERARAILEDAEGVLPLPDNFEPPPDSAGAPEKQNKALDYIFGFLKGGVLAIVILALPALLHLAWRLGQMAILLAWSLSGRGWLIVFLIGGLFGLLFLSSSGRPKQPPPD